MAAADDVPLHQERAGVGPRLVLLHGFAQTGRCWGPLADALAVDHEVVRVDAPGHGGSATVRADLPTTAGLAAEAAGPGVYVGYSMGARMALHVALQAPDVVQGLVLISGTPGIEDPAERAARHQRDRALAHQIRQRGVDAFLEDWLAQPMFAGLPAWARFDEERRRNPAEGLATSLELAGTGSQEPLWPQLGRIAAPVLALAGERDERYADIAKRMAATIGADATAALVPDAGHAAHLEKPDATLAILRPWLATLTAP
jgi:2-succinyl-6-hydroxy-2,4-cyclohexadiene-1-carboxylate synthase